MLQNLTGWHALIILAIVLIVFGAAKLPALARSVGQSVRILKDESSDRKAEQGAASTGTAPAEAHDADAAFDAQLTTTPATAPKPLTRSVPLVGERAS